MRDAVIVSTARTPIGRAYKGAFNAALGPTLGAFSLKPAIERAGIEAGEIDDVVWGAVLTQGTQFGNIGRQVALRAGCPVSVSGMTIDRQCSSGLMAIATAAKQIITDRMDVVAAGGTESIRLGPTPAGGRICAEEPAAHRSGAGRRPVRPGDRSRHHHHVGEGQGDRRGFTARS